MTPVDLDSASEFFRALGHPSRLAIVHALAGEPRGVTTLARELEMSQPLVSQHLAVLHAARLVCRSRHGREVRYALADDHVSHLLSDVISHITEEPDPNHPGEPHD